MASVVYGITADNLSDRGTGKTLLQTAMAKYILRNANRKLLMWLFAKGYTAEETWLLYQAWRTRLISNYWVSFADVIKPQIGNWLATFPPEAYHCIVLVDELTAVLPAIRANAGYVVNATETVTQLRKRAMTMIHTSQQVTRAAREITLHQTDFMIVPHTPDKGRTVHSDWWDLKGKYTHDSRADGEWPTSRFPDFSWTLRNAWHLWPQYRDDDIILPTDVANKRMKMAREEALREVGGNPEKPPPGMPVLADTIDDFMGRIKPNDPYANVLMRLRREGIPPEQVQHYLREHGWEERFDSTQKRRIMRKVEETA